MKQATALLLAVCLATICATLLPVAMGKGLTPALVWFSFAAGIGGAAAYWFTSGPAGGKLKMGWGEWLASGLFALFALRAFCWLIFNVDNSVMVLSPNNLGDMSLHLTFIRYLAKGARFWPENPIFSGIPLHYPAGIDIFNAMLKIAGCNDDRALIWVGLIGCALTCYGLLRWGRWFAVMGFLCNGGFAGWRFFHHFSLHFQDYQDTEAWKSIPLSMLVTQRGLLYAFPAGLLLLATWRAQWFRAEEEAEPAIRMPQWVQAALYSTMPLFHLHTFMFLSAMLAWWLATGREGTRLRYEVMDLLLWAVLPATVCVSLVTGLFQHGQSAIHVIHIHPGWMQDDHGFFKFWLLNLGILPFLAIALLGWTVWRKRWDDFSFVFPSIFVFCLCCIVMFAPWEWDNMKLLVWGYLGILPFLYGMLQDIPAPPGLAVRPAVYILLFLSGFVSLIGGIDRTHTGYEIAKRSELEGVEFATRYLPPDATFAGWPTYNHPLLLNGCKMVEGYDGHLMSYGIDYKERNRELTAMMDGADNWRDIARDLNVRYLFWGPMEIQGYPDSTQPWKSFPVVAAGDWGTIYDLGQTTAKPLELTHRL
ncbi:MAG TPA: hypothetical protein VHY22_18550 [Chthoniobacteraceae bacterium]|jgi:hypothetical protein|nr:hypothetical protein [Chthoniobacteraceae bacterium]